METLGHPTFHELRVVGVVSQVLIGVCRLAVHGGGEAAVGLPMDQGVQEGDGVVVLDFGGETNAGLPAVQMG